MGNRASWEDKTEVEIAARLKELYKEDEVFMRDAAGLPSRSAVITILRYLRQVFFPNYFRHEQECVNESLALETRLTLLHDLLYRQVDKALLYTRSACDHHACKQMTQQICTEFMKTLPKIQELLRKDIQAAYDGDPAAESKESIILSYPGLFAVYIYRVAHELYELRVPLIPRMMTEYAHSGTGIDIHAGARIGEYFFIDHGTGVVIGETTVIGSHVKIYQGVTLGGLSTKAGQQLAGVKRHPTIEDEVTIYSGASILGGETVIGSGSTIGGNVFITASIPPNTRVAVDDIKLKLKTRE
ncbi:MAG: serine O-acetyltransferase EpsC [Lachnospiraceae bacterium]|nr:serine acetyltransferase [Lachnospiraceae bacterium]MDY5741925.1 serine O-acetyltransferase EpsC [Lachnospiraceae bacterium]